MAVEVGIMSSTDQLQNLAKNHQNSNNSNKSKEQIMSKHEDDSWEIRAFEKDTIENMLGCTWPPRLYTCTFCRREFRSAQALGGHMNVHRRDRVKLHEVSQMPASSTMAKAHNSISPVFLPRQELVTNGLCLVYAMPNPNDVLIHSEVNASMDSSSSPFATDNKSINGTNPSNLNGSENNGSVKDSALYEEIDLELRLGRRPPPHE